LVEGHESHLIEDELGGGWVLLQVVTVTKFRG
jgi:hypothetical protein